MFRYLEWNKSVSSIDTRIVCYFTYSVYIRFEPVIVIIIIGQQQQQQQQPPHFHNQMRRFLISKVKKKIKFKLISSHRMHK